MKTEQADQIALTLAAYRSIVVANDALAAVAYDTTGETAWEIWETAAEVLDLDPAWLDFPNNGDLAERLADALAVWQAELRLTIPAAQPA